MKADPNLDAKFIIDILLWFERSVTGKTLQKEHQWEYLQCFIKPLIFPKNLTAQKALMKALHSLQAFS